MALHWIIESEFQLVTVVVRGEFTRSDVQSYLAMISRANIVEWCKLFDVRKGQAKFSCQDVNELGVRIREGASLRVVGPLAFVMPEVETPELIRLLGFLAAAKRPMRLFHEIAPARRWIMKASRYASRA